LRAIRRRKNTIGAVRVVIQRLIAFSSRENIGKDYNNALCGSASL
jgi:hypothetical protein